MVSDHRFTNLEELVVTVAANLRIETGLEPSALSLVSGLELLPRSDQIRSDLIMTYWAEMQAEESVQSDTLIKIREIGSQIKFDGLYEEITPVIAYVLSVAMIYTDSEGANKFVVTNARKYITDSELLKRLERLLDGERLSLSELSIELDER